MSQSSAALQLRYLQVKDQLNHHNLNIHHHYKPSSSSAHILLFIIPMFQTLNSISAEKNSTIIFPLPIDLVRSVVEWECSSKNITVMIVNNQNHCDRVVEWRCSNIMKNITVIIVNNATMIVLKFRFLFFWISSHHTFPSWEPFFLSLWKTI